MKRVIDQVIAKREMLNISFEENHTIQLSSVVMYRLIKELNKEISYNKLQFNPEIYEFQYMSINSVSYTIRNRNYRDDTNDSDVEEIMCDLIETI